VVRSINELVKFLSEISVHGSCGDEFKFKILRKDTLMLTEIPRQALANNLSIIDIEDVSDGFIITITKRFGKGCRESVDNASTS